MKKRMLRSMLLACMLVIMLLPTVALAEGEHSHTCDENCNHHERDPHRDGNINWQPWGGDDSLPDSAGAYYLTADVTLSGKWTVSGDVTLCLNGHSIANDEITVGSDKSLTITDCGTDVRHGYIGADYLWKAGETVPAGATECDLKGGIINRGGFAGYDGRCVLVEGGTFTLYGGNLSGSKHDVVDIKDKDTNNGIFTMYGGNITGNTEKGVYVRSSGDFIMNGGTISYNGARGVSVGGGEFTMNNGTISNNQATYYGGGVNVSGGTFTMKNGNISNNEARYGGGVYVDSNGTFTMEKGDISNNQASEGGGVYVENGTFTMKDGTIIENQATRYGGGVCFYGDGSATSCTFTMNGGTITYNKVSGNGGGVYVSNEIFTMSGGTISNNSVLGDNFSGGGVYVTGGEFKMKAGNITGNTVTGNGADCCAVYAYGTIKLSGNCTIFGNKTSNDVEKNLFVPNGKTITIEDELGKDAKIGVTTGNKPTNGSSVAITGNCSADYSKHFFSDDAAQYHIENGSSNIVVLATGATTYTVSVNASEGGTVSGGGNYDYNASVTITATPAEGYEVDTVTYTSAGGSVTTVTAVEGVYSFTMPAEDVTVTVTFKFATYNISLNDADGETTGGSYSVDKNSAAEGDTVTITVAPETGYVAVISAFRMVNGSGYPVRRVNDTTYTFIMPSSPVAVDVDFYKPNLSVTCGEDTWYADDLYEAFDDAVDLYVEYEAPVTVKVLQDYVESDGATSFNNEVSVILDLNGHHVYFEKTFWNNTPIEPCSDDYQNKVGSIWITQDDSGSLYLTDSSAEKTGFVHAMLEVMYGTLRVDSGTYYGLVFPANTKISGGTFLGMPQEIINNDPTGLYEEWIGSISAFPASVYWPGYDEEEYEEGAKDEALKAMAGIVAEGYAATKDIVTSRSPNGCWLAGFPANTSVVQEYTVTVTANPTAGGTVTGGGTYDHGATVTLTVTPASGYHFVNWTEDGEVVSTEASYTFIVSADRNLVANFEKDSYTITWKNDDGSLIDTTTVEYGVVPTHADPTKAADAQYTYTFAGWMPEIVAATGDVTYTATYSSTVNKYTVTFDANGGSGDASIEVNYGDKITKPADPAKDGAIFAGWYTAAEGGVQYDFNAPVEGNLTLYAQWSAQPVYDISGIVKQAHQNGESTFASSVEVLLRQGNTVLFTKTTDDAGKYEFHAPPGTYNIVAKSSDKTITQLITVADQNEQVSVIVLPYQNVSSELIIPAGDTPAVVVGGLDEEAAQNAVDSDDTHVSIGMNVEKKEDITDGDNSEEATQQTDIKQAASAQQLDKVEFLSITVTKTVTTNGTSDGGTALEQTQTVLELIVPYPLSGKYNIGIYRHHGGQPEAFAALNSKPAEQSKQDKTFWIDTINEMIHIYTNRFSNYAIAYSDEPVITPTPNPAPSGGSSYAHACVSKCSVCGGCTDAKCTERVCAVKCRLITMGFEDVTEALWCYDAVAYAYHHGLMQGYGENEFYPDGTVTRQQVWMILARMSGADPKSMTAARLWAMENGISDGTNPTAYVTRQQFVTMLWRYAKDMGWDVSVGEDTNILSYNDAFHVAEYAIPAMQWGCGNGVINGKNGDLMPAANTARGQMAAMFQRFSENAAKN